MLLALEIPKCKPRICILQPKPDIEASFEAEVIGKAASKTSSKATAKTKAG